MSAIPDDIALEAAAVNRELSALHQNDGCWNFENFEGVIARAIMAERERCADVCVGYRRYFGIFPENDAKTGGDNASKLIEGAIRDPNAFSVFGN